MIAVADIINNETLSPFQALPLVKLAKDTKQAAKLLDDREARYLVDLYYQLQGMRIRSQGQIRAMRQGADDVRGADSLLNHFFGLFETTETQMKNALGEYAKSRPAGAWALSITGIGPIISAGLLANIDIRRSPNVGHVWSFAGLNNRPWLGVEKGKALVAELKSKYDTPAAALEEFAQRCNKSLESVVAGITKSEVYFNHFTEAQEWIAENVDQVEWSELQRQAEMRPFNVGFKSLCAYKVGESFVRVQASESDFYGKWFRKKKDKLVAINEAGGYAEQAATILTQKKFGKDTDAFAALTAGRLPQAQIHARARRATVKLFLGHFYQVLFEDYYKKPAPKPYSVVNGLDQFIAPPNYTPLQ